MSLPLEQQVRRSLNAEEGIDPRPQLQLNGLSTEQRQRAFADYFATANAKLEGIESIDSYSCTIFSPDDEIMGHIYFDYSAETHTLSILDILVTEKFRGKGVTTAMLARILTELPDVERITGALGLDNEAIYWQNRDAGMDAVDALKHTASYKIRSRLGFGAIQNEDELRTINHPSIAVRIDVGVE